MQTLDTFILNDPFPHMIVENFYNDDELKLIWEELDFYTKDGKLFDSAVLDAFSSVHDCCSIAKFCNHDTTKVRYYHDGDFYEPHTDNFFQYLAFSYFYREPKRFDGGELFFPKYNYSFKCDNNSLIMMPAWVEHGVTKVSIKDSDYYDGYGRYAITSFFGNKQTE